MYSDTIGKDERMRLKEMVHGYNISCAIFVTVKLRIADVLADKKLNAEALAREIGVNLDALSRLMRLLVNAGVFSRDLSGLFALTPRGELLKFSHPNSIASEVLLFAGEETYLAWSELLYSVKTGKPAFIKYFQVPLFEYLAKSPDSARRFHSGWREITIQAGKEIALHYDFSKVNHVMDVGGGSGVLTAAILAKYAHLKATIYDLAFSLESAGETLASFGVKDRASIVSGDAMKTVPSGADLHILKSVLHNCSDKDAMTILINCVSALRKEGRVLVIERIINPAGDYVWGNVVDVAMLVMTGGRERTLEQYQELYRQAGLLFSKSIELPSGFSIIEGKALSEIS